MIFIGGIHGVGKSFLCRKWKDRFDLHHYSSSSLISVKKKEGFNNNKKIKDINPNQFYLLEGIKDINEEYYLLDGHFCLLNNDGDVTKIPEQTFISLSPKAIIVITDNTRSIAERLSLRDSNTYDIDLLNQFQQMEIEYSEYISSKLGIPHVIYQIDSSNEEYLDDFLKKILK